MGGGEGGQTEYIIYLFIPVYLIFQVLFFSLLIQLIFFFPIEFNFTKQFVRDFLVVFLCDSTNVAVFYPAFH